jgi:glycosyltransferase involved in cell wall biosynthesis
VTNLLSEDESVTFVKTALIKSVALLRIRNEELIIKDTLDHLSEFVDGICVYDDNSSDKTLDIVKSHPAVVLIIQNMNWLPGETNRLISETRHREILRQFATNIFNPNWFFCCDADERFIGDIKILFETSEHDLKPLAIRLSLFDAYMTDSDKKPFRAETELLGFRRFFGPERRDIIMVWNKFANAKFLGLDSREPTVNCEIKTLFYVQHYGKSLSEEHWEETCDYYINNFPRETYGEKWLNRKGKAIHEYSDFEKPLYGWGNDLFQNAIQIHPTSSTLQKIKRVLITNIWFNVFSGSEMVCLELYSHLESIGIAVDIVANTISDDMKNYCEENNINLYSSTNFTPTEDYDLVWVHHNYLPINLLGEQIDKLSRARFIFHHMSPFEPLEAAYFPEIESALASSILSNSSETLEAISNLGIEKQRIEVFGNPAPSTFREGARLRKNLQNILFVTNHPPQEILELIEVLVNEGFAVKHLGMGSRLATNQKISKSDIDWADAIITIGKSVQYAILNKLPVYIYDIHGGEGWLDSSEKLELSARTNFTGRPNCRKLNSGEIYSEFLSGFEKAAAAVYNVNEMITSKFDLTHKMTDVLRKLEQSSLGAIKMLDQNLLKIWGSYITLISRETRFRNHISAGDIKVLVDTAVAERDSAVAERDSAVAERDSAVAERDSAVAERDSAVAERDSAVAERDSAVAERDSAVAERDSILNSTIWKLFTPYRKAKNFFRKS